MSAAAEEASRGLLDPVFAWARASSLVALPFVGSLPSRGFTSWLHASLPAELAGLSRGGSPRQADLLVVVGQISQKLAPSLQRTYARMADPSYVLHLRAPRGAGPLPASYALVERLEEILPVDVVIEGNPPDRATLEQGLSLLSRRIREKRARR